MILIIGSNHDDVLYYESVLHNPREEKILFKYRAIIGMIATQEVMVIQDIYTSYLSSTIVSHLLSKYHINLVINVGRCAIVRGKAKVGDIVVSDSILFSDVDQIGIVKGLEVGMIPGYPKHFAIHSTVLSDINSVLDNMWNGNHFDATFISSSFFRQNKEKVRDLIDDVYIDSLNNTVVLDGESAGVALACFLHNVPLLAFKVVEAKVAEYTTLENYLEIINIYANVGKVIIGYIGELSRTDVVRE